jgi:hypothetical protein
VAFVGEQAVALAEALHAEQIGARREGQAVEQEEERLWVVRVVVEEEGTTTVAAEEAGEVGVVVPDRRPWSGLPGCEKYRSGGGRCARCCRCPRGAF